MTHLRSKRLPTWSGASPGAGRTLVAVAALLGSLGLGAVGGAGAAPATETALAAGVRTPGGWGDRPHGFASLGGGTTGGAGGKAGVGAAGHGATTVVERSVIKALRRGSSSNNGYITAASTWKDNPYGFLITRSKVISDAPAGSLHPGRPRHPGGEPNAVAQVLFRDTELPAAIKSSPWTDMSGFSWKDARFTEYRTHRPGARITADRPQLPEADAPTHTVTTYLAGTDGWAPHPRRARH